MAETIQITLPDGAKREVPRGTTAAQVAHGISPRLAKEALVARTNGELVDLSRPLDHSTSLSILTAKDPDAVQVFRHSAAHLLAAAVLELYPNVKLGIGPPIDNGFFYEFVRDEPFTPEDLEKIEAKMHELAAKDVPNERKLMPKPEALDLYRKLNQEFKCELVEEKASEPMVSFYTTGKFIDFCRGPHIPSTGRIKAFKLMNVAGAYWKGQVNKPGWAAKRRREMKSAKSAGHVKAKRKPSARKRSAHRSKAKRTVRITRRPLRRAAKARPMRGRRRAKSRR